MDDIEQRVERAIANERKANGRRESKRAMLVVFVLIPLIVIGVAVFWLLLGRIL